MVKRTLDPDNKFKEMGSILRELRRREKLTISNLAELLDMSEKIISNYENGYNYMTLETILTIYKSDFLVDYDLEDLLQIFVLDIFDK